MYIVYRLFKIGIYKNSQNINLKKLTKLDCAMFNNYHQIIVFIIFMILERKKSQHYYEYFLNKYNIYFFFSR